MEKSFTLRLTLFGSTRKVVLVPNLDNLIEALNTVRVQGNGISAELLVTDGDTLLSLVKRDHLYDAMRSHLKAFPLEVKGKGTFQSQVSRNPTRDLATWLLS